MEKQLTPEQKHTLLIFEELEKNAWWKMVMEFIQGSIQEREEVLIGKKQVSNEELDKIQYSRNTVLREELKILRSLADYTNHIKKTTGVYQAGS